jgi:PAS domain S-box-containing protein
MRAVRKGPSAAWAESGGRRHRLRCAAMRQEPTPASSTPPASQDEAERLAALRAFEVLDTAPEPEFDGITKAAAYLFQAPISLISFVEDTRQWFKSEVGLGTTETPLSMSICAHAIRQPRIFIVPDTTKDARFESNPLVTGEPYLRFYAGAPLITKEGLALGTLCVLDRKPRQGISPEQGEVLQALAQQVVTQLEHRRALVQLAAREAEAARLAAIVSSSSDAIISLAAEDGHIQTWNEAAEQMFGYTEEDAVGGPVSLLLAPDRLTKFEDETGVFSAAMRQGRVSLESVRRRKNGTLIDVSIMASRMTDTSGRVLGVSAIFRDITQRKRMQDRQALLIRELHHRVKNTLATVQALLGASARSTRSVDEFYHSFAGRIASLANTHNLLTEDYWQRASLHEMLETELAAFDDGSGHHITLTGPPVELTADLAVPTSMALHELATNAVRYGALSVPGGRVLVTWEVIQVEQEHRLRLEWQERDGPPVEEPKRKGFGSALLQRVLTTQCHAQVEFAFQAAGLRFSMEAPLVERRLVPPHDLAP